MKTFEISFTGNLELLRWIIEKYENQLDYQGSVYKFANKIGYNDKSAIMNWKRFGIKSRIWYVLHQDITMAYLMGKIKDDELKTLSQLKEEYDFIIKHIKKSIQNKKDKIKDCINQSEINDLQSQINEELKELEYIKGSSRSFSKPNMVISKSINKPS